jgi:hypothetical protein
MKIESRLIKVAILPDKEPIYSEQATFIEIVDESGGEFVEVSQMPEGELRQKIRIDPDEWPAIRDGIEMMMEEIRKHETP